MLFYIKEDHRTVLIVSDSILFYALSIVNESIIAPESE